MVEIEAPANLKITGEHSVVHGTDVIAAAVNKFATTGTGKNANPGVMTILLEDEKFSDAASFLPEELRILNKSWENKKDIASFISEHKNLSPTTLAFASAASKLYVDFGASPFSTVFRSSSNVPVQKGWGSSTPIGASFVGAVIAEAKVTLKDSEIIDVMRDVDRILHLNPNAGGIDVPPVYYGGYVFGSPKSGYVKIEVPKPLNFVAVNVGDKESTSNMVFLASIRTKTYPDQTKRIFESIQRIAVAERIALQSGDSRLLGESMFENHDLLRELGVSSEKLDEMVSLAKRLGAYGAKLVGGGGGGGGLVFCKPELNDEIIGAMQKQGFGAEVIQ